MNILFVIWSLISLFCIYAKNDYNITKHVLDNGFTILVKPTESTQRVAVQLWVPVGSKHEMMKEKGIAHLIEHMIFKGTKNISETDYKLLVDRLAANCDAITTYDTTRYYFNVPSASWFEVLPLMADCLINCTFKQELLNSELKAVIQELKMYRDNFSRELIIQMISNVCCDHPYCYPVVGFKHHLWDKTTQDLHEFYKKYYVVQNAVLVVVGNIDPQEVIKRAAEIFSPIEKGNYKPLNFVHSGENIGMNFVSYRPVALPQVILGWDIPGLLQKPDRFEIVVLGMALTHGFNARLHKLLVDEKKLVRSIHSSPIQLFDAALFSVSYEPFCADNVDCINEMIKHELNDIKEHGLLKEEIARIKSVLKMQLQDIEENHETMAYIIAQSYLVTGDPAFDFNDFLEDEIEINDKVKNLIKKYFKSIRMHQGKILPIAAAEVDDWKGLQEEIDAHDKYMLSQKIRQVDIELPRMDHTVHPVSYKNDYFVIPEHTYLDNGLELFWQHRNQTKNVHLVLAFKADYTYDSKELPGLYKILITSLMEGSKKYPKEELFHVLQNYGINFSMIPGRLTMHFPAEYIEKALDILQDLLLNPILAEDKIPFIKKHALQDIKHFWDNESAIASYLAHKHVLGSEHPKAKNQIGNEQSIEKITHQDVIDFYKKYISPHGAQLVITGNLENINIKDIIKKYLSSWQRQEVEDLEYPEIHKMIGQTISYQMNRDQIRLLIVGNSINYHNDDYLKLLLFDYIFVHGMNSKLFSLRERTGIFYTIGGSLLYLADEQSGMFRITTIISKDRLEEAKKMILECIATVADTITEKELIQAKNMAYFDLLDQYSTNASVANAILYCAKRKDLSYFKNRSALLEKITVADVQKAVKTVLNVDDISIIQVGRINDL